MAASHVISALAIFSVVACSVAEIPGAGSDNLTAKGKKSEACSSQDSQLKGADPSTFPKCECKAGGSARCVPAAKLPDTLSNELEKCDSDKGACVPDSVIANGAKSLPACKAKGKEGRCLSMCVPLVAKYASSFLDRGEGDACPDDERCVPCDNPLDGTPTGVCDIGKTTTCSESDSGKTGIGLAPGEAPSCPFSGTPADVTAFPECGSGGRCLDASLITDQRIVSRLDSCTSGLCVPEVYVREKGEHLPTACTFLMGIEGRCFSTVF
jgi:hypothetical protein